MNDFQNLEVTVAEDHERERLYTQETFVGKNSLVKCEWSKPPKGRNSSPESLNTDIQDKYYFIYRW